MTAQTSGAKLAPMASASEAAHALKRSGIGLGLDPMVVERDHFDIPVPAEGGLGKRLDDMIRWCRDSDGCKGDTVPLAVGQRYNFHKVGSHLGNVGQ